MKAVIQISVCREVKSWDSARASISAWVLVAQHNAEHNPDYVKDDRPTMDFPSVFLPTIKVCATIQIYISSYLCAYVL